jgi:hypothetical protein
MQLKKCAELGLVRATAMLKHCTEKGWAGLFEPHDLSNAPRATPVPERKRVFENLPRTIPQDFSLPLA